MQPQKKGSSSAVFAAVVILILVIIVGFIILPRLTPILSTITGFFGLGSGNSTSSININPGACNPGGQVSFPSNYATLENYALSVINTDRQNYSLTAVTLSPIISGQQHADSMLNYSYFSHWDTLGCKPYMRYSALNGTGYAEENVAYESGSFIGATTNSIENVIKNLEYQMMYNDASCCNNGHRDNILNQYHNRVSIGIAYDSGNVYFVEDFETYETSLSLPIASSNQNVQLSGNTLTSLNPYAVFVYYDSTPAPLSPATLNSQYQKPYDQGAFIGAVQPSCIGLCNQYQGINVQASTWTVTNSSIDIQFSLSKFTASDGAGVYTIYLVQGSQNSPEYLTSISIFVSS
jgi:uncharacterized protein YkwD